MNDEQKQPYADMREKDLERYQKQMKEFGETGTFTLEDGSSSTTLTPKLKKIKRGKRVYADEEEMPD